MKKITALLTLCCAALFALSCERQPVEKPAIPDQVTEWNIGEDRSPRDGVLLFSEVDETIEVSQPIVVKSGEILDGLNPETGRPTLYVRSNDVIQIDQRLRGKDEKEMTTSSPSGDSGDSEPEIVQNPYYSPEVSPLPEVSSEPLADVEEILQIEVGAASEEIKKHLKNGEPTFPLFKIEPGAVLKNVVINDPAGIAVAAHIEDDYVTVLQNIELRDVGPSGVFIYGNGGEIEILDSKFAYASDNAVRMDSGVAGKLLLKDCESYLCNDLVRLGSRVGPIQTAIVKGGSSRDVARVIYAPGLQGTGDVTGGFRLYGHGTIGGNIHTKAKPFVRLSNRVTTLGQLHINLGW